MVVLHRHLELALRRSPATLAALLTLALAACGSGRASDSTTGPDGGRADAGPNTHPQGPWTAIQAGSFTMGSPTDEPCRSSDETMHMVTLTHPFLIGTRETRQDDYMKVVGSNPSEYSACGADCPVDNVDWHDATSYCNQLSAAEGFDPCFTCATTADGMRCTVNQAYLTAGKTIYDCPGYRLPTEAEWEYAYRAGTQTALYSGALGATECDQAAPSAETIGWYDRNASESSMPGGQKAANAWGLYDMGGNNEELVYDQYVADLGGSPVVDPVIEQGKGDRGILRGGSHFHQASNMRAAYRQQQTQENTGTAITFRCVRTGGGEG